MSALRPPDDRRTRRRIAGDSAEDAVATALAAAGWTILVRNLRVGRAELDIVASEDRAPDVLVIVEVRSRTVQRFGAPEESVDAAKVGRLYRAAWELVRVGRLPDGRRLPGGSFRVDLVSVVRAEEGGTWSIRSHIRGLTPS